MTKAERRETYRRIRERKLVAISTTTFLIALLQGHVREERQKLAAIRAQLIDGASVEDSIRSARRKKR